LGSKEITERVQKDRLGNCEGNRTYSFGAKSFLQCKKVEWRPIAHKGHQGKRVRYVYRGAMIGPIQKVGGVRSNLQSPALLREWSFLCASKGVSEIRQKTEFGQEAGMLLGAAVRALRRGVD